MTKVDIWNKALALLPHDIRVQAEDDESTEAMRCREHWDDARRAVLSCHEWGWATEAISTAGCQTTCGTNQYAYMRPYSLRVVGTFDKDGRRAKCTVVNGKILTDIPIAEIRIIDDREDIADWPLWFTDVVTAELAARIAHPITGNPKIMESMLGIAAARLATAKTIDASEVAWSGTNGKTYADARR